MIKQMQQAKAYMNPGMAAANLARAQANAMQDAAKNQGGSAMAFMGMNMAQNVGGFNAQNLYQMGAQQQQQQTAARRGERLDVPAVRRRVHRQVLLLLRHEKARTRRRERLDVLLRRGE